MVRREDRMNQKIFVLALGAMLLALCSFANAQQQKKIPRIGRLTFVSATADSARTEPFRQGLRELGYVEGKNLIIEYASAEGTLAARAAELVHLKVDVIVTGGATATRAAKEATTTIPIVFCRIPIRLETGL